MHRADEDRHDGIEHGSQSLPDGLDTPYGLLLTLNQIVQSSTADSWAQQTRLAPNRTVSHAIARVLSALKLSKPAVLVVSGSSKK
jgi:hypothetical protein